MIRRLGREGNGVQALRVLAHGGSGPWQNAVRPIGRAMLVGDSVPSSSLRVGISRRMEQIAVEHEPLHPSQ
jgi:hypothetical protein